MFCQNNFPIKGMIYQTFIPINDNENTLFDHNIQTEITIYKQFK